MDPETAAEERSGKANDSEPLEWPRHIRTKNGDELEVRRFESEEFVLEYRHRPVIALHHVPVDDGTGRWVWAGQLGDISQGGLVRPVSILEQRITEPADKRYRWLYEESDWQRPSQYTTKRLHRHAAVMMAELEENVATLVAGGMMAYRWPRQSWPTSYGPIDAHIQRHANRTAKENERPIDILFACHAAIVQWR